jgi:hypothetical protein
MVGGFRRPKAQENKKIGIMQRFLYTMAARSASQIPEKVMP